MNNKCCRLSFLMTPKEISVVIKHNGDIDVWDNTGGDEAKHGFLMKEDTMPCDHLVEAGCKFQLEGKEKPARCRKYPSIEKSLNGISTCSFKFIDGVRTGDCNRCEE